MRCILEETPVGFAHGLEVKKPGKSTRFGVAVGKPSMLDIAAREDLYWKAEVPPYCKQAPVTMSEEDML